MRSTLRVSAIRQVQDLLHPLGVQLNGSGDCDIWIRNEALFLKSIIGGTRGILDAYVEGWWDCQRLDELIYKVLAHGLRPPGASWLEEAKARMRARIVDRQSIKTRARTAAHYELGDDLFRAMLDRRMVYSCAYWKNCATLDQAQEDKLDLVCRKLRLRPGQRLLDIGCGWGGLAQFAAERYGVSVVGITISQNQAAAARVASSGLPVEILLQDYRQLPPGRFDAIACVGMFEHVGYKNHRRFMQEVRNRLQPTGLFLLHTIGVKFSGVAIESWVDRNIFPGALIPSAAQIAAASEGLFVLEDWHNFGADYDPTLMAWLKNFETNWPRLQEQYGHRFYRMWKCYLMVCAGSFRARVNQLWQIVFSRSGILGGYSTVR